MSMDPAHAPIRLPRPIEARAGEALTRLLEGDGRGFDFLTPPGEPALVAADSVSWRVYKNPLALFIGGVAAVFLELAEPSVRTGVWEHTSFRDDPVRRLQRTGLAAMITVYGARSKAEAMIAGVGRAHAQVSGKTPEGVAYRADDSDLLDWVQATAMWGFATAYSRYVAPLSPAEFDSLYAEGVTAGRLYGALHTPRSVAEMEALFARMDPRLVAHPIVFEYLATLRRAPLVPLPLRPVQALLIRAAVDLVPVPLRERLGLGRRHGLRPGEAFLVRRMGALVDRVMIARHPAVLACRRLGLPADTLYTR
ncbi:oxygenase MpaB family protein [Acuticoccus kandeliae]|uniref:oxygenase MpaB family protein n=1 Tax=Acuticoccus kandeliae TaxID=2073160 RepID=UPI00196A3530|nr:oxygenase MpaB family protein [Acuticoccus kandeliae]